MNLRLETKRLILREWSEKDVDDLVEGLNNLNVSKWLATVPYPYTKENAENWIKLCLESDRKDGVRTSYNFAIELKSEEKVIGGMNLERINIFQGTVGGGIWINEKYQGQGLGTEAFGARIRFAFDELKLRRIENGYFKGNSSSLKMQKKFGYKLEGMKRKSFKCMATGETMDEYVTGLLKEEWKKN
ncbi:MAG TPA: GNAT family protein [Candidatus Sulfotelmatobacter sp.]|jgi:ribosomal-protein-alanine N-acetyltransferase|nr:GNAT family protein [Candidatus Sulfotelmatobacter sp.]